MDHPLETALEFHGRLPLAVQALPQLPAAQDQQLVNHGNEQVLRSVMMLEEKPDLDESDPLQLELKRQDQKLNLVLELLATLLVRFNAVPPARELQLTDSQLEFAEAEASVQGPCEVQLYIEPTLPRPLRLFGLAVHAAGRTTISFQGLSRGFTDQLDKFIFRYHRRLVASRVAESRGDAARS